MQTIFGETFWNQTNIPSVESSQRHNRIRYLWLLVPERQTESVDRSIYMRRLSSHSFGVGHSDIHRMFHPSIATFCFTKKSTEDNVQ